MTQETQQQAIDREFRLILGDLHVQLICARVQIAELLADNAALRALQPVDKTESKAKPNGASHPSGAPG